MKTEPDPLLYLLCLAEGVIVFQLFRYFPLTVSVVIFVQLALFIKRFNSAWILILLLFAGFFWSSIFTKPSVSEGLKYIKSGKRYRVELLTYGLPLKTDRGYLQPAKLIIPEIKTSRCYLRSTEPVGPSVLIRGSANLFVSTRSISPGISHQTGDTLVIKIDTYTMEPVRGGLYALSDRLRWRLYRAFDKRFPPMAAAFLKAVVIGHRDSSSNDLYRAFSRLGLSHLMSISGTHFGLFAFLIFFLIRNSARLLPYRVLVRITARHSLQEYSALLTTFFVVFYLMLSGGRIPALRAFIMIMLFLAGLLWGRDTGWKYALTLAAVIILLINPESAFSASFQLSFLAVWFIGMSIELAGRHEWMAKRALPLKLLFVPVVAFLSTGALSAYYFHSTAVFSIPMNILITPVVCFVLIPVSVISSMVYTVSGIMPFIGLINLLSEAVLKVVFYFSSLSGILLPLRAVPLGPVVLFYSTLIALVLRRKRTTAVTAFLLVLSIVVSISLYEFRKPMVTFLDVGQGDSAVVETSDNHRLVFDTGKTGLQTEAYLRYRGVSVVDALVLSHAGHDHAGGLYRILKDFTVKELWDNGEIIYGWLPEKIKHRRLQKGYVLKTRQALFTVLHPYKGYYNLTGADDNNHCLVIRYAEGPLSVLFTGDIEKDAEAVLLSLGRQLRSTVLKVAHHGSHTSSTRGFLSLVSPQIAVISVGAHNSYGHPHPEVLRRLKTYRLLRTDRDGAIRVYLKRDGTIGIARYRDMLFEECLKAWSIKVELRNLKRLFIVW